MSDDPILRNLAQARAQKYADRISRKLQGLARETEKTLRELQLPGDEGRPVFCLFAFVGGAAQYIGNGEREDIKQVVASVLARWDEPSTHKPLHEKTADELKMEQPQ